MNLWLQHHFLSSTEDLSSKAFLIAVKWFLDKSWLLNSQEVCNWAWPKHSHTKSTTNKKVNHETYQNISKLLSSIAVSLFPIPIHTGPSPSNPRFLRFWINFWAPRRPQCRSPRGILASSVQRSSERPVFGFQCFVVGLLVDWFVGLVLFRFSFGFCFYCTSFLVSEEGVYVGTG